MRVLYFYPRRSDGTALQFSTFEVGNPTEITTLIRRMFLQHTQVIEIEVCDGEEILASYARKDVL